MKGFTLIEVMVAAGLGGLIVLAGYTLMSTSIRENTIADSSNEGWLEATGAGTTFTTLVKNIPRIVPAEDLAAAGDKFYEGIAPLDVNSAPADCLVSPQFSALRVTSISLKLPSAALERGWFSDAAGGSTAATELRLSYPADLSLQASMFGATNPTELFLIDADGTNKRRYAVNSVQINKNTHVDPYDGVTKPALVFHWVGVQLGNPLMTSGSIANPPNPRIGFITQSLAYASNTSVICVTKADPVAHTDRTLVEITGTARRPLINLDHRGSTSSLSHLSVERFNVAFVASQQTARFDSLTAFPDLLTNSQRPCMSAVRFDLDVGLKRDVHQTAAPTVPVHLSRTIFLPNFATGRPVTCP
ncbi:MAG: PulJ/GspJ family protein [Bdellovibrionota bacterium]